MKLDVGPLDAASLDIGPQTLQRILEGVREGGDVPHILQGRSGADTDQVLLLPENNFLDRNFDEVFVINNIDANLGIQNDETSGNTLSSETGGLRNRGTPIVELRRADIDEMKQLLS